ncbi:unnamed protein product [Symbiodinium sp. CCMP2592]|nr:unnamed protein product [Symbiodinium sp. CCMP2592]
MKTFRHTTAMVCLARLLPQAWGAPAFTDYDCASVRSRGSIIDWNSVYERVQANLSEKPVETDFSFPRGLEYLVVEAGLETEMTRSYSIPERSREECPLGSLCLLILYFYEQVGQSHWDQDVVDLIQSLLKSHTTLVLGLTRWPIFPILAHFSHFYDTNDPTLTCDHAREGVINWVECRQLGRQFLTVLYSEETLEQNHIRNALAKEVLDCSDEAAINASMSFDECPVGLFFLLSVGLVSISGALAMTEHVPGYMSITDHALWNIPFHDTSCSPWPVWHALDMFYDMNKGSWFRPGDRKYKRLYSDWNLRNDELSPLVPAHNAFLSPEWTAQASKQVEGLVSMDHTGYAEALLAKSIRREDEEGPFRPMVRSLIHAAQAIAAISEKKGLARRLAYVVLLYGGAWAYLLERLVRHLSSLHVVYPLVVIAIGEDAANTCRELSAGDSPKAHIPVICWTPDTRSQVHRFTCIHALLHLGIDVIYTDMDTFWLRDPTRRILSSAEGWDALFARHADADCINIGVFHLRASAATALWMSQFVAWYYENPLEIDQRGLHLFLGLHAERITVSSLPSDLVQIRGSVLNDTNEVVIGDAGWEGSFSKMLVFHWCHQPIRVKEPELNAAFDASDNLSHHNLPVSLALSVVSAAFHTPSDVAWEAVQKLRQILEVYKTSPKRRTPCW